MDHATIDQDPPKADLPSIGSALNKLVTIPSSSLLGGQPYVLIEHGGAIYWLRATRAGKLILTK